MKGIRRYHRSLELESAQQLLLLHRSLRLEGDTHSECIDRDMGDIDSVGLRP